MRRLPGQHLPNNRNRSSKHLNILKGVKDVYRCINHEQLKDFSSNGDIRADKEITRRANLKKNKKA